MTDTFVEHMPKDATMKRTTHHKEVSYYKVVEDKAYIFRHGYDGDWRKSVYSPSDLEDFVNRGVLVKLDVESEQELEQEPEIPTA